MGAIHRFPMLLSRCLRRPAWLLLFAAVMLPCRLRAQEDAAEAGLFVTIASPLTSDEVGRVMAKVNRNLQRTERRARKIVFDFNPDGRPASTASFGECYNLAKFLERLQDVKTIAFVHNDVSKHTVLPVLACHEIVMSKEAKLGPVVAAGAEAPDDSEARAYQKMAVARGRYPAVVLKMLDKDVEVVKGKRQLADWYIDRRQLAEESKQGFVAGDGGPVLPAGAVAQYTQRQAEEFRICQLRRDSRAEVAEAYQLPPASLREDPLEGRTPVTRRFEVRGQVTKALVEGLQRRVRKEVGRGANFILLQLDCRGGDTQAARDLAEFLRTLKDDHGEYPVMTVAYIPERAPDTATFIALGCSEIVMGPNAEIGDFESVLYERRGNARVPAEEAVYQVKRDSLVGLAEVQGYPPLLFRGMLDKKVTIYRVHSLKGQSEWRLVTQEEWDDDQAGEKHWGNRELIKPGGADGVFLKLKAQKAKELGVAQEVVEDLPALYKHYGLRHVRDVGPDWLDNFAAFLRLPAVAVFLVMVGIACLILELKMPGLGLPGVIAALCFVLYFWAHSQLAGQITMLAVLLFVLGLILIGVEIFILPGFGVTGISGVLLLLISLGLVTLEKKPETSQEWISFGSTLGTFGLGLFGAVLVAMVVAWYLPHIPYASRLVLKPPSEEEELLEEDEVQVVHSEYGRLLGAIGVAVTTLRPAGMARFGDDFVDVMAEGSYIHPGGRVQVVEIEGNRVVVKEV